ncbi:MAG TPA: transcriptional regulator [Streptosporangiaceae bacterium]|nr:transcriptional regulator [Streptosporangiaceae bacterium]
MATPALRAGAPRLHQRARRGHAMSLEARGRAEEAVQELERAAQTVKGLDWDEWAAVQECLCRCHRRRGDLVEAVAVADRALACLHLEERPATDAAIRIGVHLLEAHRSLGDAFTARRLAGRLVRTVESGAGAGAGAGARARARLTVYAHAAAVFEEHGDHATAVTLAERAMAAAAEQETGRADALDAVERAGLLTLLGRPGAERARLLLCARERELARAGDRPRALGVCVAERARIELAMGCPAEAVAQARRAHTLLAGPPSRAAARALAVLGHGLVQLDRLPAAIETLTRGAECLEHAGYVRQAARAWYDVAEAIGRTGGGHRRRALAYRHALALIGLAAEPALPNPPPR